MLKLKEAALKEKADKIAVHTMCTYGAANAKKILWAAYRILSKEVVRQKKKGIRK